MQTFDAAQRTQNIAGLKNEQFDVLVVGGGVTGAGVALDAVTRGYKVTLVEKADFASGTSSKSTKLVHGGIRYLPSFDFALVHEALTERGLLLHNAPFLVHPIAFVLPIYNGERHPVGMPFAPPGGIGLSKILDLGLWFYDMMAGRNAVQHHRRLSRSEVQQLAPALAPDSLKEGFLYYDAQTNDARLTMALLRTAASYGAIVANYAEVTEFLCTDGKIDAARICDRSDNQELIVHARHVVNATGIFSEQTAALTGEEPQVQIEPSKGVHLVFSREDLPVGESAIVLPETDDKRILFIVPWQSRVLLGTTDSGTGNLDQPTANKDDIAYLLEHLNRYLKTKLGQQHIVSIYAGYRPLLKARSKQHSNASLSRTHAVLQSASGLVSIAGGKLTTYRRMAQDTVDVLSKRDKTRLLHLTSNLPLQGSVGWLGQQQQLEDRAAALGLTSASIAQLGKSYGTAMSDVLDLVDDNAALGELLIADLPYIKAQVIYACRHEMALTPYDVLARRTAIILEDRQRGQTCVSEVAALMAQELGWSLEHQQALIQAYQEAIQQSQAMEKQHALKEL